MQLPKLVNLVITKRNVLRNVKIPFLSVPGTTLTPEVVVDLPASILGEAIDEMYGFIETLIDSVKNTTGNIVFGSLDSLRENRDL